jgi:DNA mismatch endonuclease (patch repair protein)
VERDRRKLDELIAAGWTALVVWECEAVEGEGLRQRLINFVGPARNPRASA